MGKKRIEFFVHNRITGKPVSKRLNSLFEALQLAKQANGDAAAARYNVLEVDTVTDMHTYHEVK